MEAAPGGIGSIPHSHLRTGGHWTAGFFVQSAEGLGHIPYTMWDSSTWHRPQSGPICTNPSVVGAVT